MPSVSGFMAKATWVRNRATKLLSIFCHRSKNGVPRSTKEKYLAPIDLKKMMQSLLALKKYFGYDAFRPLQQEIIDDALANRDVFALLPTGGGKSLCFQLPALLRDGVTIVVSPLIALMKDQVDALTASGVAATFLNSTLGEVDSRARLRGLHNGEYRLLYAAPE